MVGDSRPERGTSAVTAASCSVAGASEPSTSCGLRPSDLPGPVRIDNTAPPPGGSAEACSVVGGTTVVSFVVAVEIATAAPGLGVLLRATPVVAAGADAARCTGGGVGSGGNNVIS